MIGKLITQECNFLFLGGMGVGLCYFIFRMTPLLAGTFTCDGWSAQKRIVCFVPDSRSVAVTFC
jgi:hypothetical protein